MMKKILLFIVFLLGNVSLFSNQSINLLKTKNSEVKSLDGYKNAFYHQFSKDSHTNDGSGSIELIGHNSSIALITPSFSCEKDKQYLFSAYLKNSKFPQGQNVVFSVLQGKKHLTEGYWNNSSEDKWEEVLLTFTPRKSNEDCFVRIYTYKRSFSTNKKDNVYQEVDMLGRNLDRSSKVFLDDFYVKEYTGSNSFGREAKSNKISFESPYIKVSEFGDFSINKMGVWHNIFPKLIYRSKKPQYKAYVDYGFNGLMDVWSVNQIKKGLSVGLEYFAVNANVATKYQPTYAKRILKMINYINSKEVNKPYSFLMYNYDNENNWMQDNYYKSKLNKLISKIDTLNNKRNRPVYYLNGNIGVARAYKNNILDYYDVTGTYVGGDSLGYINQGLYPSESLSLLNKIDNQVAPGSIIQLQSFLDKQLIPSLFYGLIQGGKAVSIWRDGSTEGDFQKYYWSKNIKQVFTRIDKMLPFLIGSIETKWSAETKNPWIKLGARSLEGKNFLIISNHNSKDEKFKVKIKGLSRIKYVRDYFSEKNIVEVKDNSFILNIGHYNFGYSVVELIK